MGDVFLKIIKYKKGAKGIYKVELDDGKVLALYEDVILKFELLLKKEILEEELESINAYNLEYDVYYVALNSIKARFKSTYDLKEFLRKKEYPIDLIDKAIDKLLEQGYLNDRSFARSYINNQIITTSKGPLKIEKELLEKKIDISIIKEEMEVFDEESQLEKINKIINRGLKSNRTRGGIVLKQKICNDLKLLGYNGYLINKAINEFCFENDSNIAKREYEKLHRRLSRKYSGNELESKIREKLYQKGLKYEKE